MDNLRKLRERKGLSREKLGAALGVSGQFIYRLENGDTEILLAHALALMEILDCDLDDLWGEAGSHNDQIKKLNSFRRMSLVPLICESELENYTVKDLTTHETVGSVRPFSKLAYAICIEFDRRPKRFLDGDIIIIDPGADLSSGDYCLLKDSRGLKIWTYLNKAEGPEFISHEGGQAGSCTETQNLGKIVDIFLKL